MTRPIDPGFPPAVRRRLYWLNQLLAEEYSDSPKVFEDRTGIKMAQITQWFNGYRMLREKAVLRLEAAAGKDAGFFDRAIPGEEDTTEATSAVLKSMDAWELHASPRSREVIDQLRLLAQKNALGDEDWELIQLLAQRFYQKKKPTR